jgi:hypothetical protein
MLKLADCGEIERLETLSVVDSSDFCAFSTSTGWNSAHCHKRSAQRGKETPPFLPDQFTAGFQELSAWSMLLQRHPHDVRGSFLGINCR